MILGTPLDETFRLVWWGFLFLEDFFSEPIAMCKILLYVESTEIHDYYLSVIALDSR